MIILDKFFMDSVDIISEGIQDEYTKINSCYYSRGDLSRVDIAQIIGTNGNDSTFFARGFEYGKLVFTARSEEWLGVWLDRLDWQLGDWLPDDTFTLTESGRDLLSCIPYLFTRAEDLEKR